MEAKFSCCYSSVSWSEAKTDGEWFIDNTGYGNLGLKFVAPGYVFINEIQDRDYEYFKVLKALEAYKKKYASQHNLNIEDLDYEFINYGRTELVYVLQNKEENCVTVLIKQPGVRMGAVEKEAANLTKLQKVDDHVVAPLEYFQIGDQELYATPYIYQARCIAASGGYWGMYVPEPMYVFECFSKEVTSIVCVCMIAKLVSLYDIEKQRGIGACRLSGGDFMFPKEWDKEEVSVESVLNNLYLIAAREMLECPFQEYLDIMRREFRRYTIGEDQTGILINVRSRAVISDEDIEKGINLGIELLKRNSNSKNGVKEFSLTSIDKQ